LLSHSEATGLSVGSGLAVVTMTTTEPMLNSYDLCHGGFIFSPADTAFAVACNTYNERMVAQRCDTTFLNSARRGDRLVASAQERIRAGRSGIYDVTITREGTTPIAEFRVAPAPLAAKSLRTRRSNRISCRQTRNRPALFSLKICALDSRSLAAHVPSYV
jgi:phenylacetic acid degradation protein PaaD